MQIYRRVPSVKGKEIKYEWAGEPSGQDADLPRVLRHEKALE